MRKAEGVKGLRGEGGVDEKMVNDEWSRAGVGIQKIPHSIFKIPHSGSTYLQPFKLQH